MNQAIATAQLEKTAQQKGAASNLDAQVIARGYATLTDPASATRMLAAQEEALADKDIARNQFVENYTGDPAKISTAWNNSPDNKPIFEHPKFKQFLNEQVAANPTKPVLPAGFQLVQGKSGRYGIRRPDGSVMPVGQ
jgi:multidrug efflux pump subunit AcrA (membrane-fusion protein)